MILVGQDKWSCCKQCTVVSLFLDTNLSLVAKIAKVNCLELPSN